jgi:hypothetical protein
MAVDEGRRLLLHDAARSTLGADAALVLMEMLPPTGWGDVATRRDLEALESRLELRFDAKLERLERRVIQWNIGTVIAMTGIFGVLVQLS